MTSKYKKNKILAEFKNTVENMLAENTEYDCLDDMGRDCSVCIDSGCDVIMDLYVTREYDLESFTFAHYIDGDARQPDPIVRMYMDKETGQLRTGYYDDCFPMQTYTDDENNVISFLELWTHNLIHN